MHSGSEKVGRQFIIRLHEASTDFENYFAGVFSCKFAIKIPPHLKRCATLIVKCRCRFVNTDILHKCCSETFEVVLRPLTIMFCCRCNAEFISGRILKIVDILLNYEIWWLTICGSSSITEVIILDCNFLIFKRTGTMFFL